MDVYGSAPAGWYTLTKRGVYTESPDYCGLGCLVIAVTNEFQSPEPVPSPSA